MLPCIRVHSCSLRPLLPCARVRQVHINCSCCLLVPVPIMSHYYSLRSLRGPLIRRPRPRSILAPPRMVHSSSSSSSSFRRDLLRLRHDPLCSIVDWPQCHFVRFIHLRSRSIPFIFSERRDETRRERATRHAPRYILYHPETDPCPKAEGGESQVTCSRETQADSLWRAQPPHSL